MIYSAVCSCVRGLHHPPLGETTQKMLSLKVVKLKGWQVNRKSGGCIQEAGVMAGNLVNMGSMLKCNKGMAPSTLICTQAPTVSAVAPVAATIMDFAPMENILPFGMCMSQANPEVAAATAAAMGVLTPMPCVPVTTPWSPGDPMVTIGPAGFAALDAASKCMCAWGGEITIQTTDEVVSVG